VILINQPDPSGIARPGISHTYIGDLSISLESPEGTIVELINNNDNLNILKDNNISPMFKGKILSIYFPDKFMNIFSSSHLDYFINMFGVKGAVIGHFVSYLMYYGVILLIFGSSLFGVEKGDK